jgi:RHS repeat-associated protein
MTGATIFYPAYVRDNEDSDATLYDLAGRLSAICPDIENHGTTGHVCDQYTYTLAGRILTELTRKGLSTRYAYDSSGRVCRTVHPDGHVSVNSFDYISNPQSPFTEDYFIESETDYGLNYFLERHLDTLKQTVYEEIRNCGDWLNLAYSYNGLGQKASQIDKIGNVTSYLYYASGQIHSETVDQVAGPDLVTSYTYNEDDLLQTHTDPYGNITTCVYDSENGNRLSSKSTIVNGKLTKEVYDYSTLEASHYYTLTTSSYDGSTDSAAVLTSTVTLLNEDDQTTSVSKSVSSLYDNRTAIQNTYIYDEDKQLWKIGHNGFYYVFDRDEVGTITSISVSDGTNSQVLLEKAHTDNEDGSTTDTDSYANGQDVIVITDKFGRTDKIQYDDGTSISDRYIYGYGSADTSQDDLDGQEITTVEDNATGRKTVTSKSDDADSFNQEIVVTDLNTLVQLYSCSVVNSETAVTLTTLVGATEQSYTYNKDTSGRFYQTDYELADSTAVQKTDSFGDYSELTGFVLNINSIARLQKSLFYRNISGVNFTGQVASETIQQGGTTVSYGYEYDGLGNITKITKTVSGTTTDLYRYKYDEASQLVREDNCVTNQTTTWQYDIGGNIRSRMVYALTAENSEPSNPIDTIGYGYSTGIWKDLLTSYDGQSITYDASGNPTSYLGATLTWTMGRQLASYDKGSLSIDYTYNENGIRTSKTVNNVRTDYYLNGSQVIAEVTNGSRIDYRYDGNSQLIALRYNGNEYYYVINIQGDIIGLIDGSGTSVVQYSYDAWGNQTSCTGTLANTLGQANPYRYRGYRFDTETELFYVGSRYYDPEIGRFINADDASVLGLTGDQILGVNLFAYCYNLTFTV